MTGICSNACHSGRPGLRWIALLAAWAGLLAGSVPVVFAADGNVAPPKFFRGLNLNGPAITIDGQAWEGSESIHYDCQDQAFENQAVELVPPTDAERAKMIRSSRWGGNRVVLKDLPDGEYTLFLYVWEDNNPETFTIAVNGKRVATGYTSGPAGKWEKLGPWHTAAESGKIELTSQGGAANFSGIELWQGHYDGEPPPTEEQLAFFEKRIRPLLAEKCYSCHRASAKDLEGELLVDSRPAIRRGGGQGPAVVPGNVEKSLLIKAVQFTDSDLQMPPDGKLSDQEIADLVEWVKMGAPDPRGTPTKHSGKQIDLASARQFWSLKPIVGPPVPTVQQGDLALTDIDRFILAELEERNLQPGGDADKRSWLRRATYDLTGLPPTREEVAEFLADDSSESYAKVVDRLLASPRYGERWARHWFDVIRYADTAGDNSDYPIPQMHRYRDWVIAAFNRDLPFHEFIRDQIAGDLRGGATEEERQARIIATGYLANSRRFGSTVDDYPWHLTIEDTIDNLGRAFLGTSLSCARCHDHKFDPITTRDYYAIYGIFQSTRYPWPGLELDKQQHDFVPLVARDQLAKAIETQAARDKEQKELAEEINKLQEQIKAGGAEKPQREARLKVAQARDKELRELPPAYETAYAVSEAERKSSATIHLKGNPAQPGETVPRRFLEILGGHELPADCQTSGREHLAEWIVAENTPLTVRVIVNRIWMHHFGQGIVRTPNDFGKQGLPPTHPELLDHLASQFRADGWSLKALHRRIMLSRVYRLSTERPAAAIAADPANQWLAGYPRRRLDAESIRDTLLILGGNLDLSPAGAHPFPDPKSWGFTQHHPFKAVYDTQRRSVYLMTQRIQRHPFLAIFDGADPSASTPVRMTTTTPVQALYLLNDPFVHHQSKLLAERVRAQASDPTARIGYAYELLFCRVASDEEIAAGQKFLTAATELLQKSGTAVDQLELAAWSAYLRTLLRTNEFVYFE